MQFIVKAYDGEGMLGKRMEVRPRHLEGIERIKEHVICAGGLLDDEGKMKGRYSSSELIIKMELPSTTHLRVVTSGHSHGVPAKYVPCR